MSKQRSTLKALLSAVVVSAFLYSPPVLAGKILGIRGKRVKVRLDDPAEKGDLFYVYNNNGKKRGIIKLKKIKGLKAYGVIVKKKGKIKRGWTIEPRSSRSKRAAVEQESSRDYPQRRSKSGSDWELGFLFGFSSDTLHLVPADTTDDTKITASGTGSRIKVLLNWRLMTSISLQMKAGLFSVTGSHSDPSQTTTISYMDLDAWGRYHFSSLWVGAGLAYLSPASSDGLSQDPESTSAMGLGLGYDFNVGSGYIPIHFTYNMLLGATQNLAESIALSFGYTFSL